MVRMAGNIIGSIVIFSEKMNSEAYITILPDHLFPSATHLAEGAWIYQQDDKQLNVFQNPSNFGMTN